MYITEAKINENNCQQVPNYEWILQNIFGEIFDVKMYISAML